MRGLNLLNARNVIAANDERKLRETLAMDFSAVVAEESDRQQAPLRASSSAIDDVARSSAGGDSNRDIFRPCLGNHWRRKITSVPTSLASAVMLAGSRESDIAGIGW